MKGRGVLVLKTGYVRETNGRYYVTSRMDSFLSIEPAGAELVTKTVSPVLGKTVDNNFVQTLAFVGSLSRTAEVNSRGVQRLGEQLTHVQPDVREQFVELAAAMPEKHLPAPEKARRPKWPANRPSGRNADDATCVWPTWPTLARLHGSRRSLAMRARPQAVDRLTARTPAADSAARPALMTRTPAFFSDARTERSAEASVIRAAQSGEPAESPEGGLAQLRAVGDDEHAAGRSGHLRQHARQLGRLLIDGAVAVDGVGPEKGHVGPQGFEIRLRDGAGQIGRRGAQAAAEQQDLDPLVVLQLGGDRQRRGNDGQAAPAAKPLGQFQRGRARIEHHGFAVLDLRGGRGGDGVLGEHGCSRTRLRNSNSKLIRSAMAAPPCVRITLPWSASDCRSRRTVIPLTPNRSINSSIEHSPRWAISSHICFCRTIWFIDTPERKWYTVVIMNTRP